jgi:hypothetical protein
MTCLAGVRGKENLPAISAFSFSSRCVWYWVHEILHDAADRNPGMPWSME